MATKDLTRIFYEGKIKVDYKDKAHRYYAYPRIDFDLPIDDRKAWGKQLYPKGTTTLIGDTLEKNGLMNWSKGLALRELTGFYDFYNDKGERLVGFSKDVGTLWDNDGFIRQLDQDALLPIMQSANEASNRRKKKGADIGSIVHEAIENYIKKLEFDIGTSYMWAIKEAKANDEFESLADYEQALKDFQSDTDQANLAFAQFVNWWEKTKPTLYGAEELLYSLLHNICGTYDANLGIPGSAHPIKKDMKIVRCTVDWKTSNASASKSAAMPEGINYQYFTQSAIYEMIRREMGEAPADDLLIVSARKDGGFSLIYASELGLSVEDCIRDGAEATIRAYRFREKVIRGLLAHAEGVK